MPLLLFFSRTFATEIVASFKSIPLFFAREIAFTSAHWAENSLGDIPIKRQFGYEKVRFRGLPKNTAQMVTLFALSNLWMARRHLLAGTGEVRV